MALTAGEAAAQELLVELRANGSAENTGTMGGEVTFLEGATFGEGLAPEADAGFDNTAGGVLRLPDPNNALDGLTSFTFSMFIKAEEPITSGRQTLFANRSVNNWTEIQGRDAGMQALINNDDSFWSNLSDPDEYAVTDEWMFVAVAVDGISGDAEWWLGTESSGELVLSNQRNDRDFGSLIGDDSDLRFGSRTAGSHPLPTLMDNIRLHGSYEDGSGRLTETQVNDLFESGLAEIPEPGSLALLGAGGLMLLARRRRTA